MQISWVDLHNRYTQAAAANDRDELARIAATYEEHGERSRAMQVCVRHQLDRDAQPAARKPHRKGPGRMHITERTEALYRAIADAGAGGILPMDAARAAGVKKSAAEKHAQLLRAEGRIWTELGPRGYVWVAKGTTK